jgi:ABC-2 type transport system permease protein
VYFRDFENVVATLTIFTHWAVPMIYPYERLGAAAIPGWIKEVYLADPLAIAVLLMQKAFWAPTCYNTPKYRCDDPAVFPSHLFVRGLVLVVIGAVFLWLCQKAFSRMEVKFADRMSS